MHSAIGNLDTFAGALARNSDSVDGILAGIERMTGGGTRQAEMPIYDLAAANGFPALAEAPAWQLVVPEPTALLAFNTDKITASRRRAGETRAIRRMRDGATTCRSCSRRRSIQSFENAGYASSVSRPRDGFNADYQLLHRHSALLLATSSAPEAEIEFVAKVLGPDGKIVAAKTFEDRRRRAEPTRRPPRPP